MVKCECDLAMWVAEVSERLGVVVIVCTKPTLPKISLERWLVNGLGSPAWGLPAVWGLLVAALFTASVLSLHIQMCEVCK